MGDLNNDNNVEDKLSKNNKNKGSKTRKGLFFEWIVPILLAVIIALLIKQFIIFKAYIPSESMVPTLNVGDHLLVTKVYNLNNLKRGNIIVFNSKELDDILIKRLIGLPGDDIKIVNGKVSVNGEELEESYIINHDNYNGEFHVPEGRYFFLGDNRPNSFDSRKWVNPYIDGKDIMGKAQVKVYPFKDFGTIK
ncbi:MULTISPECIES: signal peptidase I [Clostridium]|uniref:Signal peptidase I n=1 Tax=Clostridium cibarium TaxID=2762247 RepID=A0ABR8PUU1_9CLOT|nr:MULTISPECIES: signal peptidase I [Clostridium]MBD7911929.1 signal peptidase I [Clostridium cibarium]